MVQLKANVTNVYDLWPSNESSGGCVHIVKAADEIRTEGELSQN